uniref:Uncharacterized protein n=1 Tax=Octopus bimaculoides TaxID=37653 RepID=A0A0L8FID2_OCTBM
MYKACFLPILQRSLNIPSRSKDPVHNSNRTLLNFFSAHVFTFNHRLLTIPI